VPKETFVAYWIGEERTPPSPRLDQMPPYVDVVPLAYALIDPNTWRLTFDRLCLTHSAPVIQAWVKEVRANGSKVLLSINDTKLGSVPDVPAFVDGIVQDALDWGVDGIDFDYENWFGSPSDTVIEIVKATRPALAKALGSEPFLSAPVYYLWPAYPDFLHSLAADLDLVMTMDYTPYGSFDVTTDLFNEYAAAIGSPEKVAIGMSCMQPSTGDFTPLKDVERLCKWEPPGGTKAGGMLYTFSYDVKKRPRAGTGYPDGTFTKTIEANLP
jgi:hypothetical protein